MSEPVTLLTESEAARHLRVCPRTLRKERQAGRLAYIRMGRGVRYHPDDLATYIESMRLCQSADERAGYARLHKSANHAIIRHKRAYVDGIVHTNTIEGFWSLVKRAFYGSHHHYSRKFMPLFIGEACWKYNQRKNPDAFGAFMKGCFA